MTPDACKRFLILILLEKVEEEVECEAYENNVIYKSKELSWLNLEWDIKDGGEAGVADDK